MQLKGDSFQATNNIGEINIEFFEQEDCCDVLEPFGLSSTTEASAFAGRRLTKKTSPSEFKIGDDTVIEEHASPHAPLDNPLQRTAERRQVRGSNGEQFT